MGPHRDSLTARKALARSCIESHRLEAAQMLLDGLCADNDNDLEAWHLQATVCGMLGLFPESERCSRHVLSLNRDVSAAHYNLGVALMALGEYLEAQSCLETAVRLNEQDQQAHYQLGRVLVRHSEAARAIFHLERALQLQPEMVQASVELANLYREQGDLQSSQKYFRMALALRPPAAELHYNLGTVLQAQEKYRLAEASYRRALELNPDLLQASNNLGLVYQEQGRFEEASQCFNQALERTREGLPGDAVTAELHRHRALLWLLRGEFDKGWSEYEWRHTDRDAVLRKFTMPRWNGASLSGRVIMVHAEQGIGDEIMFASCIPDLMRQAGHVVLECNPRLASLFRRSFPGITVFGSIPAEEPGWLAGAPEIDVQIPAGSLPGYLRRSLSDFPQIKGYLVPESDALQKWRDRYAALGAGLKVGVSWRGGRAAKSKMRSIAIGRLTPLFHVRNACFVNLQYGDCVRELFALHAGHGVKIHDWKDADPLLDLDDFAAQVAALDLVISIDNATVHMAAALGTPVWLLQTFLPEWRWQLGCTDSYWYSGVRQFRQPRPGDWEPVIESLRAELSVLAGTVR